MSQGFTAARELGGRKFVEKTKQVTRPPHPELADVKPGDELLVVNFTPDDEFVRRIRESDSYLNTSLKNRIDELEDDDGEGGALVPR